MAMTAGSIFRTILFIAVVVGLGSYIGYAAGSGAGDPWYEALRKAPENPPGWAFPVAWTFIYTMMAIAAAYAFEMKYWASFNLFLLQLAMNYAWSFVFFKFHKIDLAFAWICVLFIVVFAWARSFWPVHKALAVMQGPYLVWLLFAAYLSYEIMILNPSTPRV